MRLPMSSKEALGAEMTKATFDLVEKSAACRYKKDIPRLCAL
jgi:hypothetical protein